MSAEDRIIDTIVQLGDGFEAARGWVDKHVAPRLRISPALRAAYLEIGVHESRVDAYFEAQANGKKPSVEDYKEPLQVAELLEISYDRPYVRR